MSMKRRAAALATLTVLGLTPRPSWPQDKEAGSKPEPPAVKRDETVVVTASRSETNLVDAPATTNVATAEQIAASPSTGYTDVLRMLPGINVIEMAPGAIDVTSRLATGAGSHYQLTLVDGRPLSLNFVGITLWQFAPLDIDDAKRIEVVQGPASVVWGANAVTGVVNILSRSPREDLGTQLRLGAGLFGRDAGQSAGFDPGATWNLGATHARAFGETWALRVNAGYFDSDAWPRPAGRVPVATHPLDPSARTGGAEYPPIASRGTTQARASVRVDQQLKAGGLLVYEAGLNQASDLQHSPIGPFFAEDERLAFVQARYEAPGLRLRAFGNFLDGQNPNNTNLLARDADGQPVRLLFKTQTFDLDGAKTWTLGERHILSVGADVRRDDFDRISTAPGAMDRNELGMHAQAALRFGRFHVDPALRFDKFSSVDGLIFSPRLAVLFKPTPAQSVRASFARSFAAPSAAHEYFDLSVTTLEIPPGGENPFRIVTHVHGDPDVNEESLTTWELAYTAAFGRTTASAAVYLSDLHDPIGIVPAQLYSPENPPPGWPLPPSAVPPIPSELVFANLGPVRNRGFELGLSHRFASGISAYANYSWQHDPVPLEPDPGEPAYPPGSLNVASHHRVNLGLTFDRGRFLGGATLSYLSEAFWADVLVPPFWGPTPAHTLVGASFGVRLAKSRLTLMVKAANLLDQDVQYHVFGDIVKRSAVLQAKLRL
jgi:outer membrane receptor protein involved in Fe transport